MLGQHLLDISLVLALTYAVLALIGERRTLWMVRGFVVLMLVTAASRQLNLALLSFFLHHLTIGAAVAMAVILQSEFRRLLETIGRGDLFELFRPSVLPVPKADSTIDEIVDAIKELSQNRTGALIVVETNGPLDDRDFSVPGVRLNAEISKELLQTIFQTSTLLHDGAVLIQSSRITAAGAILPISERQASRQLGTRHRAAMGITERVEHCLCIVVSEETGSISLAERGKLNRPLTSSKLRDLLEAKLAPTMERETVARDLKAFGRNLGLGLGELVRRGGLALRRSLGGAQESGSGDSRGEGRGDR
ncbi:MAG: diadenylate cyclase CdaA [Cyanophyceae cyanobacterium]